MSDENRMIGQSMLRSWYGLPKEITGTMHQCVDGFRLFKGTRNWVLEKQNGDGSWSSVKSVSCCPDCGGRCA